MRSSWSAFVADVRHGLAAAGLPRDTFDVEDLRCLAASHYPAGLLVQRAIDMATAENAATEEHA